MSTASALASARFRARHPNYHARWVARKRKDCPDFVEELRERNRKWRANNPEYFIKNKDKLSEKSRKWQADNPERVKTIQRKYNQTHPEVRREYVKNHPGMRSAVYKRYAATDNGKAVRNKNRRLRELRKIQAVPKWANLNKISIIYRQAAQSKLTVDHIIPLKHCLVCGLHVETNLRLITFSENASKNNRWHFEIPIQAGAPK